MSLYGHLVGARIRGQLQYRLSFYLYFLGQFGASFLDLLSLLVIFHRVTALRGWSIDDVLFLYGTSQVGFTVADLFASQVERCAVYIREGTFDQLLCRPLGALFQLSTGEFELRRAGRLLQSTLVLVVACTRLPVPWTVGRAVITVAAIVSASVTFASIWIVTSSLAFWTIDTQEVANAFTYGGGYLVQYPVDVFSGWLRRTILIVPLSFVTYVPVAWVLGRPDVYGFPVWLRLASPAAALASALVARAVWRTAVRHYRSTGS